MKTQDSISGTFHCPMCGKVYPHEHTGEEIAIYNGARSSELELRALNAAISTVEHFANLYVDKGLDGCETYPLYGVVLRAMRARIEVAS